ncbi:hybrid sensor histidine kinase/response regulator [Actinoplanes aureus]|uniref:histidine kinase n=1 Tax=Actinoplanes aureus TaxID=2792083 RepID=A0A931CLH7_9ACTN|nr:response regulator [Actinoplanes aureus]MBG0568458.1 response regulator [Actinoplanes aureus]
MATVLVVDDSVSSREVARATLDDAGHQVIEAAEGRQALALAHAVHPDVVVTDVVMPGMDGYEFANELHSSPDTAGIPVLLYTANYQPDEAAPLAAAYGVAGFVAKTGEPADLVTAVLNALRHNPPPATTAAPQPLLGEHLRTVNAKLVEKVLALHESEARLSAMAELSPAGIALGGPDLDATYINPQLSEITATPTRDLLHDGWRAYLPPQQTGTPGEHDQQHDTTTYYGPVTLTDGRQRTLHAVIRHLRDDNSNTTGFLAVVNDVTQLIEAEQHRHNLKRELEATERRRIHQRFESLARMSGAIAHDFNNILGIILNYGEFIEDTLRDNAGTTLTDDRLRPILDDLDHISRAGRRAANLAHQLLTFGGREIIEPVVVNPNAVIHEALGLLDGSIARQLDISTNLDPHTSNTRADPDQLCQILLNLAINARDAMPQGGRLAFHTTNTSISADSGDATGFQPGDYIHIAVADTGEGMPPDVAERAIEPFFTTKPKGHGTGLGLATAYGIAKQAGGNLVIDSTVGQGTTIHLYLPATDEQPPATEPAAATRHTTGQTILVADDEDGLRTAAARMLTAAGYHVLTAADGEEALQVAQRHHGPIHALLTDVVMPHMNGPELAQHLRHHRPATPVLYMSGYAAPLMTEQGILEPGVTVVGKPFTRSELLTALNTTLTGAPNPSSR